jgi:maltose phosphorylase
MDELAETSPNTLSSLEEKTAYTDNERQRWHSIIGNTYLPYDSELQVFLQQDGFLDKDLQPASALKSEDVPINQKWSWDRILRSCYIKQADVLQGLYFFEHHFDLEEIKRNFEFYEPMTVHESSLSPCIHVILACRIGQYDKAYELYMRTARLDLDDYNNDTEDGLHITSMAGTWLAITQGFGGMKMDDGILSLSPQIPDNWEALTFRIVYRGATLRISCTADNDTEIENLSDIGVDLLIYNEAHSVQAYSKIQAKRLIVL